VTERLGVFGGTFDPPHNGHVAVAVNARHQLGLGRVLLVVANEPWQKTALREVSPVADRLALARAAVEAIAGLEVSTLEIDRGGPSYTADTLAALRRGPDPPELFLVLGWDAAAGLPTWERAEEVRRATTVAVVRRPGQPASALPSGWRWAHVDVPRLDVSSTDLRARVADGAPIDGLVPPQVATLIARRGLYRGAAG
jgi:nicotinate-nucleotide adenylyltransferase